MALAPAWKCWRPCPFKGKAWVLVISDLASSSTGWPQRPSPRPLDGVCAQTPSLVRQAGPKRRIRGRWQVQGGSTGQWLVSSKPDVFYFFLKPKQVGKQRKMEAPVRGWPCHGELGTRAGPTLQGHLTSQPRLSPQESVPSVTLQETGWLGSYLWSHCGGTLTPAECPADSQGGMGDIWHHCSALLPALLWEVGSHGRPYAL